MSASFDDCISAARYLAAYSGSDSEGAAIADIIELLEKQQKIMQTLGKLVFQAEANKDNPNVTISKLAARKLIG